MPRFELSDEELDVLVDFLSSCRGEDAQETVTVFAGASADRGRALLTERRCTACHTSVNADGAIEQIPLQRWDRGCLTDTVPEASPRPRYELSDVDNDAVVSYLSTSAETESLPSPSFSPHTGALTLEAANCQACHRRDGRGGLAELMSEITTDAVHLVDLTPVMRPPSLDGVGEKFPAAALREAIARPPVRRPWLQTRMPSFALAEATLSGVSDHLIAADRTPPRQNLRVENDPSIAEASLMAAGRRLVTSDGFGCTSCHQIGTRKPGEKRPEALGPELSMLGGRVRREWFDRFVREPTRLVSGLEMPSIMAPVTGVLGDDLGNQLDAVWHVLNQPGFNPPEPGALRIVRATGRQESGERASVITDVLRAGDRTFIKPLLIGLPNRHNVLVDLESGGLADWRLGDAAEQRTEGKSWFWQARGERIADKLPGVDVRLVRGRAEIVPLREGQFQIEYDALERVDDGIRYAYRLFFPDASGNGRECVHVAETITGEWPGDGTEGGFRRRIEIADPPSADRVLVTVAQNINISSSPILLGGADAHAWRLAMV